MVEIMFILVLRPEIFFLAHGETSFMHLDYVFIYALAFLKIPAQTVVSFIMPKTVCSIKTTKEHYICVGPPNCYCLHSPGLLD